MNQLKVEIFIKDVFIGNGLAHLLQSIFPDARLTLHSGLNCFSSKPSEDINLIILDPELLDPPKQLTLEKIYKKNTACRIIAVTSDAPEENLAPYLDAIIFHKSTSEKILSELKRVIDSIKFPVTSTTNSLISEREKEVLRGVALGQTNNEISDNLFISSHTVITHRKNISAKIGIKTIAGLAVYAVLNGIISPDEMESA